jgi:hypothetical protein
MGIETQVGRGKEARERGQSDGCSDGHATESVRFAKHAAGHPPQQGGSLGRVVAWQQHNHVWWEGGEETEQHQTGRSPRRLAHHDVGDAVQRKVPGSMQEAGCIGPKGGTHPGGPQRTPPTHTPSPSSSCTSAHTRTLPHPLPSPPPTTRAGGTHTHSRAAAQRAPSISTLYTAVNMPARATV